MWFGSMFDGVTDDATIERWTLNRAGILNVYQYENETIDFHGGRLLLRGVNGSGKSTAMNMLLPFLITARQTRIDAAGEQTGVLKSWMLNGHDDPQPVGYLWLEFLAGHQHLVCGCGIKANRQSDTINTWWFVTARRPGIDFDLIDNKVPRSLDSLRAVLGEESDVFAHDRRHDYRQLMQRRLFGGADIDQHIKLLNVVRNPRIGDRIDVDLPAHLVDALPQLSDRALAEAAQPLDDLEDHRRHVSELERTRDAIEGLLAIYQPYCQTELSRYLSQAKHALRTLRQRQRDERRTDDEHAAAAKRYTQIQADLEAAAAETERLGVERRALEASDVYKSGADLHDLRDHADDAARAVTHAAQDADRAANQTADAARKVERADDLARDDRAQLDEALSSLLNGIAHLDIAADPMPAIDLADPDITRAALSHQSAALRQRRADLDDVQHQRNQLTAAEQQLTAATQAADQALQAHHAAVETLKTREAAARNESQQWYDAVAQWSADHQVALPANDAAEYDIFGYANAIDDVLARSLDDAQTERATAQNRFDIASEQRQAAAAVVAELAERTEPEMADLPWQRRTPVRLADLIDFRDDLSDQQRAGLEGALSASGLLHARITSGAVELQTGELVAVADQPAVAGNLADLTTVTIPDEAAEVIDISAAEVERLLSAIAVDLVTEAVACVTVTGEFRIGPLQGRFVKPQPEFIGRTARRAALERERAAAATVLAAAENSLAHAQTTLAQANAVLEARRTARAARPALDAVRTADALAAGARDRERVTDSQRDDTERRQSIAEQRVSAHDDEMRRVAANLRVPADRDGFTVFEVALGDLKGVHQEVGYLLEQAVRSHQSANSKRDDHLKAVAESERTAAALVDRRHEYEQLASRLATLEDSIGSELDDLLANLKQVNTDLDATKQLWSDLQAAEQVANRASERAANIAAAAVNERQQAENVCEEARREMLAVVALPGIVNTATAPTQHQPITTALTGAQGLGQLVDQLQQRLPDDLPPEPVDAESVRMSLRQRRDSIGSGWDAEARQPDPTRPLLISVQGPSGRGTLVDQRAAIVTKHTEIANLLTRKQDDALRELLQGLIAKELSEKIASANHLIGLMNERLGQVRTAHDVGVELRWRRAGELDEPTLALTELLAMMPSLRRPEDDAELRRLLADRLDGARREQPDVPYRQLLAGTLDYRRWHELVVLLHRGADKPKRLRRSTPLSEGEKKLVTYLPMFAAVAASCDALAEARGHDDGDPPPPRFVLLDDAFAKVSEDNHAALFGLIVGLDLDLIATSERLWGTHTSVPALAITEVIRDAALGAILLEHYQWDGAVLEHIK